MTVRLSDKMRNLMLDGGASGGIKAGLTPCWIAIFTGSQPASANTAATGTLLGTVSINGAGSVGLTWDAAAAGVLSKASAETWRVTWSAAGTAGWFRIHNTGDTITNTDSTKARIDGSCGTSGADLNLTNITTAISRVDTVDGFTITLPANL